MAIRRIVNGELRGYIHHNGRWCRAYILSSHDQMTLLGDPVRIINFKLTKSSKNIFQAEKSKFHKKKPVTRSQKRSTEA